MSVSIKTCNLKVIFNSKFKLSKNKYLIDNK